MNFPKSVAALLSSFAIFLFFAESTKAALLLEPAITYENGDSQITYPPPFSASTGTVNGVGLGGRIGFDMSDIFFFALDGRYSAPKFVDNTVGYDARAIAMNWGPVAGIQMPVLGLRIWGAYIVRAELDPETSGTIDVNFKDGSGYRLGAGLRFLVVSLNIEYEKLDYETSELERLGPFSLGTSFKNIEMSKKSWIASLSFPIRI